MEKEKRGCKRKQINLVHKLWERELKSTNSVCWRKERFRNFQLQGEADTSGSLQFVFQDKLRIVEIIAAADVVIALTQGGVCAAFDRLTFKRLCYLNTSEDEVIRSVFHDKLNKSLITVSVHHELEFSSLTCRTTPLTELGTDDGFLSMLHSRPLFASELLHYPGFVEFDDVNGKVLTYSAIDKVYKVWDLKTYNHLYSLKDPNIEEIKVSPGILLLIYKRERGHVPLEVVSINTGEVLKSFKHLIHRQSKVDFIEPFNEKVLFKQEQKCLQSLDIRTKEITEVEHFLTPSAFIFLYEPQLYLTLLKNTIFLWNSKSELVTRFEDHLLWYNSITNMYITSRQDMIFSYCKDKTNPLQGSINASHIFTGASLMKICGEDSNATDISSEERNYRIRAQKALTDITALFYNEDHNEIYTGTRQGTIHVWSN